MSVQKIIQEAVNENPLGLKEALEEELRARVSEAIAVKMEETDTQMGTIAVTSDEERKKRAQLYRDKKTTKNEEFEQIDEVSKKTAIDAYRRRQSQADDWYAEPDDQKKADATLRRIGKKFGSKTTIDAQHGVDVDRKGRGPRDTGLDYLFYKQDTYDKLAKPGTKKGTSQRKDYMKLNKGTLKTPPRFSVEEVELDEADAVVTHKWYSIKHWKDGSRHFDNLDDHLRGHTYKHAALGNTAKNRPDHHIGIPVKASSAIAYMDKHAKPIS
jgi:hypothetical protein